MSLVHVLHNALLDKTRIRVFYGNPVTGNDDCQDCQTQGVVRAQDKKLVLYLRTKSKIGVPLDVNRIVKITDNVTHNVLYQHENYDCGEWTTGQFPNGRYTANRNKLAHATFEYQEQAEAYIRFITGQQNNPTPIAKSSFYNPNALANALKGNS